MKFKKTILIFGVMISILFTSFIGVNAEFTDINSEDSVLAKAVDVITAKGITKGISDTEFGTEEMVTREQMAAFVYRMVNDGASLEGGENETAFTDLDDPTFYAMISLANKEGVIKGVSETQFNPKGNITLQDCYTIVLRALGHKNLAYPDGFITKAKEKGLTANISESIENDEFLTRGDVAIILHNAISLDKDHVLDGKKVLFIGNSYTYYGNMVQTYTWDIKNEEMLHHRFKYELGGFYRLCQQNGANVSVTNWTYGSHTLQDLFGGGCFDKNRHPGYDHLADLRKYTDMNFDYVVIQAPTGGAITNIEDYKCLLGYVCNIFREVNPDVEIIYSVPTLLYTQPDVRGTEILEAKDAIISEFNLTEANWGKLIADILSGEATVENSTQEYTNNTFLVSKSADDGFHPNLLTGYIGTQMIYSLITGEKAVGQDYSSYTDASFGGGFDVEKFVKTYYTYDNISPAESETKLTGDDLTNFPEIFASKTEMEGIQKLIDEYINANK